MERNSFLMIKSTLNTLQKYQSLKLQEVIDYRVDVV